MSDIKKEEASARFAEIACEFLNHAEERDALGAMHADSMELADKLDLSEKELENIFDSINVRVLRWGDQPENYICFTVDTKPSDIVDMIDDTFGGGDYGDENNEKIDAMFADLRANPDSLLEDIAIEDPVSNNPIIIETMKANELLLLNEAWWLDADEKAEEKTGCEMPR